MEPGTMKPTKMPFSAIVLMIACHLTFPLIASPVFLPPLADLLWTLAGGPAIVPINLLLSCFILALAVVGYRLALPPLGRLLRHRETRILNIVSSSTE
jgi:membrane protease YdiL (CAAX protease family)